ncbi:hypothetical protein Adt_48303 [Abeliophyllum distichum]|uniref:Uncharacterized protein n=1 Tax=Abeliophyllum distichum TaxID=126358 RepID=A0ABD1NRF7_9LAMI
MAKTIGSQRPLNPRPPPSLREAPPVKHISGATKTSCDHEIYKLSSSFLVSEELIENLRQWFITVANYGRLKPSFSDGNSCNKHENIAGVGRDPKPAPPSPKPAPGTRWKLPSPISTTGVGRDPKPAPPSPKPAPGTRWKLPSPITTTGVGRDPEPAPPSPKSAPGTRPLLQQLVLEETRSQRLDSQSQHLELAGSYHPSPGDFLGKLDKKPLYNLVHIWYAMLHR